MVKTIVYIKKDKVKENGDCPLYLKVTYNRKSITLATGKYISEERWKQTDNLRRILRQDKEKVLKEYLDLLELKIDKIANQLERHQEVLSIQEFKLKILGKEIEEAKPSILDIIQIHNTHFAKLVNIGERSNLLIILQEHYFSITIRPIQMYYSFINRFKRP